MQNNFSFLIFQQIINILLIRELDASENTGSDGTHAIFLKL